MDYKKPRPKNFQEERILLAELGFSTGDFVESNGLLLLSEQGIREAEKRLERELSSNPQLRELFKLYKQSLQAREKE